VWRWLWNLLTVNDPEQEGPFTLPPPEQAEPGEARHPAARPPGPAADAPAVLEDLARLEDRVQSLTPPADRVSPDLEINLAWLRTTFNSPPDFGLVVRRFRIASRPPIEACLAHLKGLADRELVDTVILKNLMRRPGDGPADGQPAWQWVREAALPANEVEVHASRHKVAEGVARGQTAVFLAGEDRALLVETPGWEKRPIQRPLAEVTVRGSQEGFTEDLRTNVSLVRKIVRDPDLTVELYRPSRRSLTEVAFLHVRGLTNPALVEEVRYRLRSLRVDHVHGTDVLGQMIEDAPNSFVPLTLSTERPDRVAAQLLEGNIALLAEGSPFAVVAPATVWSFIQTAEDASLRWPFATFLRMVRVLAAGLALVLPAFYISLVNYHPEAIPTDLLLAIAGARERVPFPSPVELILIEAGFEVIREAGVRIPTPIGPTLGIVGAVILGEAAVGAGLISPLLIIVVAMTALGSFAVPNPDMVFGLRLGRFALILVAGAFGFFGLALGLVAILVHVCSLRSFGVPLMAPAAPWRPASPAKVLRAPPFAREERPRAFRPRDRQRQPEVVRPWDPEGPAARREGPPGTGGSRG